MGVNIQQGLLAWLTGLLGPILLGLMVLAYWAPSTQANLPELPYRTGVLPEPQQSYALPEGDAFQFSRDTVLLVPHAEDRTGATCWLMT